MRGTIQVLVAFFCLVRQIFLTEGVPQITNYPIFLILVLFAIFSNDTYDRPSVGVHFLAILFFGERSGAPQVRSLCRSISLELQL